MRTLATPAPVNFVYLTPFDVDAARTSEDIDAFVAGDTENRFLFSGQRADLNMIAMTYFYLRAAGIDNVILSPEPQDGAINIMHSEHIRRAPPTSSQFTVCVQGDYPRRPQAQFHIVQNRDQLRDDDAVVWLWPQPGLLPRAASREDRFRRIGYLGQVEGNLAHDVACWQEKLRSLDLEFVAPPPDRWHDYRDIDAVVGVRRFARNPFPNKPPSKLVNAWFAGVPFIGGTDSAFRQVGHDGEDYLEVRSEDGLMAALKLLRDRRDIRERIVNRGRESSVAFTKPALIERWCEVLQGPVTERYQRWRDNPRAETLRHSTRSAMHRGMELAKRAIRR